MLKPPDPDKFKMILEIAPDPVIIVDRDGYIIFVNAQVEKYFGYLREELIGELVEILIPSALRKKHVKLREQYVAHPVVRPMGGGADLYGRHKNGRRLDVDISLSPLEGATDGLIITAIIRDVKRHRQLEKKLDNLTKQDPLTGLINLRFLMDRLDYTMGLATRQNQLLAVLYIDVDNFKSINDTYGHSQGNLLLKLIADRLTHTLRKSDVVARFGGDEFVCLITGMKHQRELDVIIQKIHRAIGTYFDLHNVRVDISVSIGVSIFPKNAIDSKALLEQADAAMYQAKSSGKNCYCYS